MASQRYIENTYELPNGSKDIPEDDLRRALTDFEYLAGNYMQIVNKRRKMVPFKLNPAQRYLFKTLWPMISPETRLDRNRIVVIPKSRQIGISVFTMAFINYICAYAEGVEHMSILHVLPIVDSVSKLSQQKIIPIISGVHPEIFPNIRKETLGSSVLYYYDNILGVPRHNTYEVVSSSAKSIRGSTNNIICYDECQFYRHPEDLEDICGASLPDHGFSLSVFFSTFSDGYGEFFRNKILMAMQNPDDADLVFIPWQMLYPEEPLGATWDNLGELNEYEKNVIIPALNDPTYDIPREQHPDKILWYRRKKLTVSNMKNEFPTTLEELLTLGQNKCVFSDDNLSFCENNTLNGKPCTIMTDNLTKETKAVLSDHKEPFVIYADPKYGHRYRIIIDPIMSQSESSDFFALSVFDISKGPYEQVAVFHDKDLAIEDYADIVVSIAKIYNKAEICPEQNVAEALVACIRALGYYNFFYEDQKARAKKNPGIRTTVTSKPAMIDKLILLLNQENIIIRDKETLREMKVFEKQEKRRRDGSVTVKQAARGKHHDDLVMTLVLFAGSLREKELTNTTNGSHFAIM